MRENDTAAMWASRPTGRQGPNCGPACPHAGNVPGAGREILLLRHGATPGNELHRYNGRTDESLSAAGRKALSEKRFDPAPIVYVTPLRRTKETAAILFPAARQIAVPGLREMDFGDFEGRSYADMADDPAYRAWVDSLCAGPIPNGEGRAHFVPRCVAAFRAVLAADQSDRLVFVIHGGSIMAICSALATPKRDYFDWQPPNDGGFLLRTVGEGPELELIKKV
jgi:alpha-ribazole phosphatase